MIETAIPIFDNFKGKELFSKLAYLLGFAKYLLKSI